MGTNHIYIDTGGTIKLAAHSFTEDADTKFIGRSVLANSAGTELSTDESPLKVNLVAIGSGTLAKVTSVTTVVTVATVTSINTLATISSMYSLANVATVSAVSKIASVDTVSTVSLVANANITSVGSINTVVSVNTLSQFAHTIKTVSTFYSTASESSIIAAVTGKLIKVFALSVISNSTASNVVDFKNDTGGTTVWTIPLGAVAGANISVPLPSYLFASSAVNKPITITLSTANTAYVCLSYTDAQDI